MKNVSNSPKLVEVSKQFCEIATGAKHPRNDNLGTFLTVCPTDYVCGDKLWFLIRAPLLQRHFLQLQSEG